MKDVFYIKAKWNSCNELRCHGSYPFDTPHWRVIENISTELASNMLGINVDHFSFLNKGYRVVSYNIGWSSMIAIYRSDCLWQIIRTQDRKEMDRIEQRMIDEGSFSLEGIE